MNNQNVNVDNLLTKYMHMFEKCANSYEGDESKHDWVLTGMGKMLELVMKDLSMLATNKKS